MSMYPWQSGRDGRETTQKLHLNPLNGHWGEDHSIPDTLRHDTGWPPHFPSPSLIGGSDTATIVSPCQDNVEFR
jgi:hypothetical protein